MYSIENVDMVTLAWAMLLIGGTWAWKNRRIGEFLFVALAVSVVISQLKKTKDDGFLEEPALDYLENLYSEKGEEGAAELEKWKEQFPGLADMTMGDVMDTMTIDGVQKIDVAINHKKTDHLVLEGIFFSVVSAQNLAEAIQQDSTWKRVSFIGCFLDPTSAGTIGQGFRTNYRINHVDFANGQLEVETVRVLATKLVQGNPTVQILTFDNCGITDEGAEHIAEALTGGSELSVLSLKENEISPDVISSLEGKVATLVS